MLVLLVGTGIYLNIALRFFSFRNWVRAYKCLWQGRSHQSEHGEISPWNALMTALAADIGTGNVVGVALAIAVGGPGALFWMWVTALVGMMTKFSEVLLSVHFREKTPAGNWVGGAMYFIKNGLGPKWVWLGTCFAVFGICACIGTGGMVQAKAITDNISGTFGLPTWLCGLILVIGFTVRAFQDGLIWPLGIDLVVIDVLLLTLIPGWYTGKPALTKLAGVCNIAIGIISAFLLFPALFA